MKWVDFSGLVQRWFLVLLFLDSVFFYLGHPVLFNNLQGKHIVNLLAPEFYI